MNIRPVIDIVTVAGATLVLSACSGQQTFDTALQQLNGGTPILGSDAAEASLVEVALPVEPPAPVYERVCWIELHRAGTMQVEVCENRLASP